MPDPIGYKPGPTRSSSNSSVETTKDQQSKPGATDTPAASAPVDDFSSYMLSEAQKGLKTHEGNVKKLTEERKAEDKEDDPDDDDD